MARSLNKTQLLGFVGADPLMRATPSGVAVVNFRVATTESWKDRETGEKREATEWHTVVAFGKPAEFIEQYVKKGDRLYVEGSGRTRKWTDKDNITRYSHELIIREFPILLSPAAGAPHESDNVPLPDDEQSGASMDYDDLPG